MKCCPSLFRQKARNRALVSSPLSRLGRLAPVLILCVAAAPQAAVFYASPQGSTTAAGTQAAPLTLAAGIAKLAAGDTLFVRGGTYAIATQVTIERGNDGAAGKRKCVFAYAGEKPVLDFSSQPYGNPSSVSNPRGIQINGNFWHIRGLEVKGSADNGIYVAGNDNIVEACVLHRNRDTGLQLGRYKSDATRAEWPERNLILNCESYDNYDLPPASGENADGFAAKLTVGDGNVFKGCIAHHNIDDGWDLYTKTATGPIGVVTIDQCIAYANGTLTDGTANPNGDRNGFKLGGEDIAVGHIVTRSVAFGNGKNGFTWNSNPGPIRMINNLAYDNAEGNYKFGDNSTPTQTVYVNNVSFWTKTAGAMSDKTIGTSVASSNCWWDKAKSQPSINGKGLIVTAADFAAPLATSIKPARLADGSIDFAPFRLAKGSDLIDAGVVPDGDLPFTATYFAGVPDLGAVEGASGSVGLAAAPVARASWSVQMRSGMLEMRVPRAGRVELRLYDAQGRQAREWISQSVAEGIDLVTVNVAGLGAGVYLATASLDGEAMPGRRVMIEGR